MFVIFSVTLMSLAAGAGLLAQLGLAIWWAMVGSLAIYAALLSLHLVARRQFAALDQAANERLQAEINALMPDDNELSDQTDGRGFARSRSQHRCPATRCRAPGTSLRAGRPVGAGHALPEPRDTGPVRFQAAAGRPRWSCRTPGPALEQAARAAPSARIAAAEQEVNVEYIQELIKKLADELNGPVQAPLPE